MKSFTTKSDLPKFREWFNIVLIWIILNLSLNFIGVIISYFVSDSATFNYTFVIELWLKQFLIEGFSFALISFIAIQFLKSKRIGYYIFVIVQVIVFHVILVINLEQDSEGLFFVTDDLSFAYNYILLNGQIFYDFILGIFPFELRVDGGIFAPVSLLCFYFFWMVLPLINFTLFTYFSLKLFSNYNRKTIQQKSQTIKHNQS